MKKIGLLVIGLVFVFGLQVCSMEKADVSKLQKKAEEIRKEIEGARKSLQEIENKLDSYNKISWQSDEYIYTVSRAKDGDIIINKEFDTINFVISSSPIYASQEDAKRIAEAILEITKP